MTDRTQTLPDRTEAASRTTGVLPYQSLAACIRSGEIAADQQIISEQLQPASLDLRLGPLAYRLQASFLPGPDRTVQERIDECCLHTVSLTDGALLERGCVYIVPLLELSLIHI